MEKEYGDELFIYAMSFPDNEDDENADEGRKDCAETANAAISGKEEKK